MSIEQIIESRVNQITRRYSGGRMGRMNIEGFKDAVERQLYDFQENHEKLLILYKLKSHFDSSYQSHLKTCEHKENPTKCLNNRMFMEVEYFLGKEIKDINPELKLEDDRFELNTNLMIDVISNFSKYPRSAKLYQRAMDKIKIGNLDRNCLDDIRLSLEILLKELLDNKKSLENQLSELGPFLKDKGCSKEIRNLIGTVLKIYSKHNNEYVKHDDKVNQIEVGFIINLTTSVIKFLMEF